MDQELAVAVFSRWEQGLPVSEGMLHKAASAIGVNPDDALLEARFYTMLDHGLAKVASGHRLSDADLDFYAVASGGVPSDFIKTASTYQIDHQELVLTKLAENGWVPDLMAIKRAMMDPGGQGGAPGEQGGNMADPAAGGLGGQPNAAMPPIPDQSVQQDPRQRFKPSPMAPSQVPPSDGGNLQELARSAMSPPSQDMQAGMGVGDGMGGSDMGPSTPAPPPPSPEEKLQQTDPSIDPDTMSRWAPKLQEIEEQTGIQMNDPAQIQKFVGEMQKADQKTLDDAIKAMGQTPPQAKPTNPNAQQGQQQPPAVAPAAQEKVANVAKLMARAFYQS